MKKGPYILPQFTFGEVDSMKLRADVIVIPFMNDPGGQIKIDWIKGNLQIVAYHSDEKYIINECLERISQQYGNKFQNLVRQALDYN
jgi:hypothetical protein